MKHALVIYKKSQYQIYVKERKNKHIESLIENSSEVTKGILASHQQHLKSIDETKKILAYYGIKAKFVSRASEIDSSNVDIVFSIGGDGTLLWTQKKIPKEIPLFGINSDPERSVGALCCSTVDGLKEKIKKYLENPEKYQSSVTRMSVSVNGNLISNKVLNDVLFCHKNPAATTSNILILKDKTVNHKSSGVWVSTAIGSTGAMKSAGGVAYHRTNPFIQWKVREPITRDKEYLSGIIQPGETLSFISKMREGMIALDGSRECHTINMGDRVDFSASPESLILVK